MILVYVLLGHYSERYLFIKVDSLVLQVPAGLCEQTCSSDHSTWLWVQDWWGTFYLFFLQSFGTLVIHGDKFFALKLGMVIWWSQDSLKCPKFETPFLALLPGLRPGAIIVLGIHRGAFRHQELRSLDAAVGLRIVQRRGASAAEAPRMTTEVVGMLSSTHKGTMNALDSTYSKLFKEENIHKHIEQVSMHLSYNITVDETMCSRKCSKNW